MSLLLSQLGSASPFTLTIAPGAVPVTGSGLSLRVAYRVAMSPVAVPVAGRSLALTLNRRIAISLATVPVTGQGLSLRAAFRIALSPATVPITGQSLALSAARRLALSPVDVPVNGQSVGLASGYRLAITSVDVPVVGQDITLTFAAGAGNFTLAVNPATVAIDGQTIDLIYTPVVATTAAIGGVWVRLDKEKRAKPRKQAAKRVAYRLDVAPAKVAAVGEIIGVRAAYRIAVGSTHIVLFATAAQQRNHTALSLLLGCDVVDIGRRRTTQAARSIAALKLLAEAA
jgi:hypothetical protein